MKKMCLSKLFFMANVAGDRKKMAQQWIAADFAAKMNHTGQISAGPAPMFDGHIAHIAYEFSELKEMIDCCSSRKFQDGPKFLKPGDAAAIIDMVSGKSVCAELFSDSLVIFRFLDIKQVL